jgi:hypothetical protein
VKSSAWQSHLAPVAIASLLLFVSATSCKRAQERALAEAKLCAGEAHDITTCPWTLR